MTKNLEMADAFVKLMLAILVIAFCLSNIISGTIAWLLISLATLVIVIFALKVALLFATRD